MTARSPATAYSVTRHVSDVRGNVNWGTGARGIFQEDDNQYPILIRIVQTSYGHFGRNSKGYPEFNTVFSCSLKQL